MVGAKVCDLTEDLLWFVCGLYVGVLMSSLKKNQVASLCSHLKPMTTGKDRCIGSGVGFKRLHEVVRWVF